MLTRCYYGATEYAMKVKYFCNLASCLACCPYVLFFMLTFHMTYLMCKEKMCVYMYFCLLASRLFGARPIVVDLGVAAVANHGTLHKCVCHS